MTVLPLFVGAVVGLGVACAPGPRWLRFVLLLAVAALSMAAYQGTLWWLDHPVEHWFDDPNSCDGPCNGWWSFERDVIDWWWVGLAVVALGSPGLSVSSTGL
jgi:hypothetical protein